MPFGNEADKFAVSSTTNDPMLFSAIILRASNTEASGWMQ